MKAVILAAGCATRLRPYSNDVPKTLLPVAGVPMLRRSITNLMKAGFTSFVIGTGYLEHLIRDAVGSWFPELDVTYVHNPDFRTTNNGYSLGMMKELLEHEDFLLIDGDVVYDAALVSDLVARGLDCLAVRSQGSIGLEEVKVHADDNGRVLAIGKTVPVPSAMGESVGIELFSAATSFKLFAALHQQVHGLGLRNEYYEAAFQQIIDDGATLLGVDIGGHYASEIDTIDDLKAADAKLAAGPAFDGRATPAGGLRIAV